MVGLGYVGTPLLKLILSKNFKLVVGPKQKRIKKLKEKYKKIIFMIITTILTLS